MTDLAGKGAVVTGGASGIGYATAAELGRRGCQVVLADIEGGALDEAVARLGAGGIDAHGVRCDVTVLHDVQALAARAFDLLGRVHVVFHNAGVAVAGPVAEMTHDEWRWVIDVDLWGPIHGVEAFLPPLIEQGEGGHMVFTSSFAGLVPNVGLGPYTVAKYGVVALAEVLERELRPHGIGVSVLCPMRVVSNIADSARNRQPSYGEARPGLAPRRDTAGTSGSHPGGGTGAGRDRPGRVLPVEAVAALTVDAVEANRLYVLPHEESRGPIQRRFARIDRTFDEQR
ncbi:MAG: SDR family NAD(P)-dependent oxidoreductase [Acidimicrobiales bacterium]